VQELGVADDARGEAKFHLVRVLGPLKG
jgi:hypothetical protein